MKKEQEATVKNILLALVVSLATGCTFGRFSAHPESPAMAAQPPCVAGDVCPVDFGWIVEVMGSAR